MQVCLLQELLGPAVKVGTVDRFRASRRHLNLVHCTCSCDGHRRPKKDENIRGDSAPELYPIVEASIGPILTTAKMSPLDPRLSPCPPFNFK